MPIIRVTKEFNFEAAHSLYNYDGKCKNIHGHSYKLFVTIIGKPITNEKNPKLGMVIDFGDLKKIVNKIIIDKFDHAIVVSKKARLNNVKIKKQMFERLIITDYQPTCENMVLYFSDIIKKKLPENLKLFSIKLHETATSYAEWFASDN